MRYLIDTNIFLYLSTDRKRLHPDVLAMLSESESLLYISIESVRELIVAYNNKGLGNKKWKISHAMTLKMPLISSDTRFEFYRKQGLHFIFNEK